jgi:crotonobetaine/carnitine-CoA ligase
MTQSGWGGLERSTTVRSLRDAAERQPDELLVEFPDRSLTYGGFLDEVHRLAHGLLDLGVHPGDRVATILDNNSDALLSWFAINTLGAIQVPVNTALKGAFLAHQLIDSDARLILCEARYLERIPRASPISARVLCRGVPDESMVEGLRVEKLAAAYTNDLSAIHVDVRPEQLTTLYYTAGTTGPAKGCMVSHNFVCHLARQSLITTGRRPEEHQWTPLPLFHMNAPVLTVLASILIGGSATVSERFSVSGFWPAIKESRPSIVMLLGSMVQLIADMEETEEIGEMRGQIRVAWAIPFPQTAAETWRQRFGVKLAGSPGFGQTETGFLVSAPLDVPAPPNASGRRNEFFDVMVVDDDGEELAPDASGEIVARPNGPELMFSGYWKRPEATAEAFHNLWYHTGDIGQFDADGWFYFVDRKKDYLRRRGENISSFEMERAICDHPDILEAAVFSVPSEISEDEVKVVAVLSPGSSLTEEELCRWTFERVPRFAVPRFIEFRPELPKSEVGRVFKHVLREEPDALECWDREAAGLAVPKD